jgi:hypothetical protein
MWWRRNESYGTDFVPENDVDRAQLKRKHAMRPNGAESKPADPRPRILVPGDDRLVSDVAKELGERLQGTLYIHGDEVVIPRHGLLHPVSPAFFRTLVERHLVCKKRRRDFTEADVTMSDDHARAILASDHFAERLQPLERVNTCRLPVFREGARIELLPEGYDAATRTLTRSVIEYREDMTLDEATALLTEDFYSEFEWNDGTRSLAIALAGSLTLFAGQLLPVKTLRPCFIVTKNAEGAGATTLVRLMTAPVLGEVQFKARPATDDEMRKHLTSAVRTGSLSLVFDNVSGHLKSPALEACLTSTLWGDRLLGSNTLTAGPNLMTVFITGNGLTVSPDMARRALIVELHQSWEHPGDRVYKKPLDAVVLHKRRAELLAAQWALVQNWQQKKFPGASRVNSAFPEWGDIVGGIVEAARFDCPLNPSKSDIIVDEDGADMHELVAKIELNLPFTFPQLVTKCRDLEIFPALTTDDPMSAGQRKAFGKLLARYHNRLIGGRRFVIKGNPNSRKSRRYVAISRTDD